MPPTALHVLRTALLTSLVSSIDLKKPSDTQSLQNEQAAAGGVAGKKLKLAGPLQLSGEFEGVGKQAKASFELWQAWAKEALPGYHVVLELRDDGSDEVKAKSIAASLAKDSSVDVIIAPYTSRASLAVVNAVQGRKPILVWGGAESSVFTTGNKNVFGFLSVAEEYLHSGLEALRKQNASEVIFVKSDKAFSEAVCSGARSYAKKLGMSVTEEVEVNSDASNAADAMDKLQSVSTDVAVICGERPEVARIADEMTDLQKYPNFKANMILSSSDFAPSREQPGRHWSDCIMSPSQWSFTEKWAEKDAAVGWTSKDFTSLYENKTGEKPSPEAAAAAAAVVTLSNAINAVGASDIEKVFKVMSTMEIKTFYGPVAFKSSGALSGKDTLALQYQRGKEDAVIVGPTAVQDADLIYPCQAKKSGTATLRPCIASLLAALMMVLCAQ
eukprot:TRINITY_DN84840_c0_g1_i1.p1 TRINITY_DN84840_c0_g1~~TRINITY_DN84840_c0_g1_i1.p1  ORF type:complete len:443 (+),score=110.51 TRINITY_DN84840_c0_g1_i1:28-1356(+)